MLGNGLLRGKRTSKRIAGRVDIKGKRLEHTHHRRCHSWPLPKFANHFLLLLLLPVAEGVRRDAPLGVGMGVVSKFQLVQ